MAETTLLAPFSMKDRGVIIQVRSMDCSLSGRFALYDISMTCESSRIASIQGALRCAVVALIKQEAGAGESCHLIPAPRLPALQAVMEHGGFPAHTAQKIEIGEHFSGSERDRRERGLSKRYGDAPLMHQSLVYPFQ